jgi:hypothetical protein
MLSKVVSWSANGMVQNTLGVSTPDDARLTKRKSAVNSELSPIEEQVSIAIDAPSELLPAPGPSSEPLQK